MTDRTRPDAVGPRTHTSGDAAATDGARPVDPAPTTGILGVAYEATMVGLAITVVALLGQPDRGVVRTINLVIWGVFVVDYATRLALSGDRRTFMRRNVIDLIAILPADLFRAARALRILRLLRLLRSISVLWRVSTTIRAIAGTNALGWVLAASGLVIVLAAGLVMIFEPSLADPIDALWWSVVTATTVGYGDLAPVTPLGRGIAVALMIVGIGTIGMITGSIATFFLHGNADTDPHLDHVRSMLDQWGELSPAQRQQTARLLADLATHEPASSPAATTPEA